MQYKPFHVLIAAAVLTGCTQAGGCGTGGSTVGSGDRTGTGKVGTSIEVLGTIADRTGTCPAITFTLAGTTVSTDRATDFDDRSCERTVNGDRVKVEGTVQADRSVIAASVEGEDDEDDKKAEDRDDKDDDDKDAAGSSVDLEGLVVGNSGRCPALTFWVDKTRVTTDRQTTFDDTTCDGLANGDDVEIEGTRQPNGSVLASKIEKDN